MKRIIYTLLGMMLSVGAWAQTTLQEQIDNAADGATITLTENVTISQTVLINKNITINGDGHTITSSVTNNLGTFYVNVPASNFNITNAIIDGNNTASMAVCAYRGEAKSDLTGTVSVVNNNTGNIITLTNCTVKNFTGYPGSYVGAIYAFSTSTFNLSNCTFTGNTTSLSTNGASGADVWAGAAATVNINGGSYQEVFVNSNAGDHAAITISGSATVAELAVCVTEKGGGVTNQPAITIDNATVTNLVTETGNDIPSSAISIPNGGSITNMPGNYVAQIGDKKYATLAEAIAAATDGQTIKLLADVSVDKTILINQANITIDGNGKTIKSTVTSKLGTFYVNNKTCNLTIQNATIDGQNSASMAVCVYRGKANDTLDGTPVVDNDNAGNSVTLTNCTVENFTGYPGSYVGAVYAFSHSHLTLNNCTFTGNTTSQPTNGASGADVWTGAATTVVINGGTYNEVFVNTNSSNVETVTINGGAKIEELAICVSYKADGATNIPVLTIDNASVTNLTTEEGNPVPADEISLTNGGTITNMPSTEVAKILNATQTNAFASLDDAITAANEADKDVTVTLLADATATKELASNVTIDANGKALILPSFNVADGADLAYAKVINATDNTYTVATATYNRTGATGTQWGTVCLPFSITAAPAGYSLYTPSAVGDNVLTVTEVSYPVAIGTPVIFFKNNTDEAVITSKNASVKIDATPVAQSGTVALVGTFTEQNITTGLSSIYFINGDKFHQAKASLTVPAYRAYIKYSTSGARPSVLNMNIVGNDNMVDGIGAVTIDDLNSAKGIYDINGRLLSSPQKGVNIMKLANGKTVKMIVK